MIHKGLQLNFISIKKRETGTANDQKIVCCSLELKVYNYMKKLLFLCSAITLSIIACQNKEEAIIQEELNKVQTSWIIQSFNINGATPDSLRNVLKTGEFLLKKCKFSKKEKKGNVRSCTGDFFFNGEFYSGDYEYNTETKIYKISVYILTQFPETTSKITPQQAKIISLLNGDWNLDFKNGILTATQIKNNVLPAAKFSFTAIMK